MQVFKVFQLFCVLLVAFVANNNCRTASGQQPIAIAKLTRTTPVNFADEVLPILQKNCLACHSATEANGDLVLETPAGMLKGGDSGPAIVAGKGAESLLVLAAAHAKEPIMPPPDNDVAAANLTSQQLGLIKLWIDQGAKTTGAAGAGAPKQWRRLPPGDHPIYALVLSPDGQFAACGRANQIFIYHVQTGQVVTRLTDPALAKTGGPGIAHLDVVQSLAFSKQGDRLASGGFRTAKIWRYPRNVQRLKLGAANNAVTAVAVSPNRELVATAGADHTILLSSAKTGETLFSLAVHSDKVRGLCFSRDSSRLFSASLDKSVQIWDTTNGDNTGRILTAEPLQAITTVTEPAPAEPEIPSADAPAETPPPREMLVTAGGKSLRLWSPENTLPPPLVDTKLVASRFVVSKDGRYGALASDQGDITLLEIESGETVQTMKTTVGTIKSLALSVTPPVLETEESAEEATPPADVIQLAIGGAQGKIKIWRNGEKAPIQTLLGSASPVTSLAFSPTIDSIIAGNERGEITQWKLDSASSIVSSDSASLVVLSADGKTFAAAHGPAVVVYDSQTNLPLATLRGHTKPVSAMAFSPDGTKIVTGGEDHAVILWDWSQPKFPQIASFTEHAGPVRGVALNADATKILSGGDDNVVRVTTIDSSIEPVVFTGHSAGVVAVAWLGGSQPVSASADKSVRFWNLADGKVIRTISAPTAIADMTATVNGAKLIVAAGSAALVYQATDGKLLATLAAGEEKISSVRLSGDDSRLLVATPEYSSLIRLADNRLLQTQTLGETTSALALSATGESILLSDVTNGLRTEQSQFLQSLDVPGGAVTGLVYRKDGAVVFSGSATGAVTGHTLASGEPLFSTKHSAAVNDLQLSPDETSLAIAGEDKAIKLFNAANGAALASPTFAAIDGPVESVCFAAEGTKLIARTSGESNQLLVYSRADGTLEQILETKANATGDIFSSGEQGNYCLTLSNTSETVRYALLHEKRFDGHTSEVTSLGHVADLQVVSGSADGTIRHWNLGAATALIRSMSHGGPITSVAAHAEVGRFASVSSNNTIHLWNAANGQQLAQMGGDLNAKLAVTKLNLQKTDWTAKVAAAQAALTAAQQQVPLKTTAEKSAETALAAALKDMQAKAAVATSAQTAKVALEKAAITASSAAQAAAMKQLAAQIAMEKSQAALDDATQAAARAKTVAASDPSDTSLAKVVADAEAAVVKAATELKAAQAAMASPTAAATKASTDANAAAQKVVAAAKVYTDAAAALAVSQTAHQSAAQAHRLATDDLNAATAAVPTATAQVTSAQDELKKVEAALTAAIEAESAAHQPLLAVAFSPDGSLLATGGESGIVHTWGAAAGKAVASFVGHTSAVGSLAFASENDLLSGSAEAVVWELNPHWELERVIGDINDPSQLGDRVVAVDFSNSGEFLATGGGEPSRGGEVKVWKVADGSVLHSWPEAHTDGVNAVAFSADDRFLASASADKFIRSWDIATGEQAAQFEGHTGHVLGVAWRSNGRTLASCGGDNVIRTWNAETGDRIREIGGYTKQVSAVKFVGQSQNVVSASGQGIVRFHNSDNGGVVRTFGGSSDYMYAVDTTANSSIVVAGGHAGVLRIWNGANGQLLREIEAPKPPPVEKATGDSEDGAP